MYKSVNVLQLFIVKTPFNQWLGMWGVTDQSGKNIIPDGYLLKQQQNDWYRQIEESFLHVELTSYLISFIS